MGYPLDAHMIYFPMSGIQNIHFIMCQIYKIKFQDVIKTSIWYHWWNDTKTK